MPLDISSPSFQVNLPGNYTKSDLTTAIELAFLNCGYPAVTNKTLGTTDYLGYTLFLSANGKGAVKFIVEISGTTIYTVRARLYHADNYNLTTWTQTNNTGANNTIGATFNVANTSPLSIYCVPLGLDLSGIVLSVGGVTFSGMLGISYPSTILDWYDENLYVAAGLIQPNSPSDSWLPYPNPLSNAMSTAYYAKSGLDTFGGRNPINQEVQLFTGSPIIAYTHGVYGFLGSDIAISNNNGFAVGDVSVVSSTEKYWNLAPQDNGIAIRIV